MDRSTYTRKIKERETSDYNKNVLLKNDLKKKNFLTLLPNFGANIVNSCQIYYYYYYHIHIFIT